MPSIRHPIQTECDQNTACSGPDACCAPQTSGLTPLFTPQAVDDTACCGPPPGPASSPYERPGYRLCAFVQGFRDLPGRASVPQAKTRLAFADALGTVRARLGIARNAYKVAPGLYCVGAPGPDAEVLVTANYKLSFDALRREADGLDAWILVLDTRGINVWCAAGKGTFSTAEVVRRVREADLAGLVNHRRLILPQLGATGVAAHEVKRASGFEVVWGPVRAADLKAFLAAGRKAEPAMRGVTFTLKERLELIPIELAHVQKYALWVLAGFFLLSGIGPGIFSFGAAWMRGWITATALAGGVLAGAVAAPVLLPWLPGKAFALKGSVVGAAAGLLVALFFRTAVSVPEGVSLVLLTGALSSFLAMNFTGSTPYTSPSGVEKEMRRAIPLQAAATIVAVIAWIGGAFTL